MYFNDKMTDLVGRDIIKISPLYGDYFGGYEFVGGCDKEVGYLLRKPNGLPPCFQLKIPSVAHPDRWDYEWYHNDLYFPFPETGDGNGLEFREALAFGYGCVSELNSLRSLLKPDTGMFGCVFFDLPDEDVDVKPSVKLRALSITETSQGIISGWRRTMDNPFCVYEFTLQKHTFPVT
jgi:hypothetical protein